MYSGYITNVDKKIRKSLNIPVRKKLLVTYKKATISMAELEKIFESIAQYLEDNALDATTIAFTIEQKEESRNGEVTSLDFEIPIQATDAGQKNLLPDKLAIDIANDDNPDQADLDIPSEIANEISSDQDDEPPYDSSFVTEEEPSVEQASDSNDDPFSDFQEDSEAEEVFDLDADDETEETSEEESEPDLAVANEAPVKQAENPSAAAPTVDQAAETSSLAEQKDPQPESAPEATVSNDQILNLSQYLANLSINQQQLQLSKKDILADYGLPEFRKEIDADDLVSLAKFDFVTNILRSRQSDLAQWQNELTTKQTQLLTDLKQQLTGYYQKKADPEVVDDLVENQLEQIMDAYNDQVLQPQYAADNKEIVTQNKELKASIQKQLAADQAAAAKKLADEAQIKIQQAQKEYEANAASLQQELQDKATSYRTEQRSKLHLSSVFTINQQLIGYKNQVVKDFQQNATDLAADYLKKLGNVQTEIQIQFDQSKDQFEANAIKKRELERAEKKEQRDWDYKTKELDSQIEIAKAQNPKPVIQPKDNQAAEHISQLYDQLFNQQGKFYDQMLKKAMDQPQTQENQLASTSNSDLEAEENPTKLPKSHKGVFASLTAAGAILIIAGGFGLYHHENAKINQLAAINSQLSSQVYKMKQTPTTQEAKVAAKPQAKVSLNDLLAQKKYQKAMTDYNDLQSLDQIAQRLYLNKDTADLELLNSKYDVALGKYNHAILKNDQVELQKSASQLTDFEKSLMNQDQKKFLSPGK